MIFLPNNVFTKILGYCDDRIERKQKYYTKKLIASIEVLYNLKKFGELQYKIQDLYDGWISTSQDENQYKDIIFDPKHEFPFQSFNHSIKNILTTKLNSPIFNKYYSPIEIYYDGVSDIY